jgi:hypothetical protein
MSLFSPEALLNAKFDSANATRRDPLPVGETTAQIIKLDFANGVSDRGPWYKLNVVLDIADAEYLAKAEREKASITYGIMLDMTEGGTFAMGPNKNVQLGRLREATGTNQPGKGLNDMMGQYVRLTIAHRPDPKDPSIVYDDVRGVAKI